MIIIILVYLTAHQHISGDTVPINNREYCKYIYVDEQEFPDRDSPIRL